MSLTGNRRGVRTSVDEPMEGDIRCSTEDDSGPVGVVFLLCFAILLSSLFLLLPFFPLLLLLFILHSFFLLARIVALGRHLIARHGRTISNVPGSIRDESDEQSGRKTERDDGSGKLVSGRDRSQFASCSGLHRSNSSQLIHLMYACSTLLCTRHARDCSACAALAESYSLIMRLRAACCCRCCVCVGELRAMIGVMTPH